jgi:hypothetical protein
MLPNVTFKRDMPQGEPLTNLRARREWFDDD